MKKILCFILMIFFTFLISCNKYEDPSSCLASYESESPPIYDSSFLGTIYLSDEFKFSSYDGVKQFFTYDNWVNESGGDFRRISFHINEGIDRLPITKDTYGVFYSTFLNNYFNGTLYNMFPTYNNKLLELGSKYDWQTEFISLFSNDEYMRPWLWYNVKFNDIYFDVKILLEKVKCEGKVSDLIYEFSPRFQNVHNFKNSKDYKIYDSRLILNNKDVYTLNYYFRSYTHLDVVYVIDDTLVEIRTNLDDYAKLIMSGFFDNFNVVSSFNNLM